MRAIRISLLLGLLLAVGPAAFAQEASIIGTVTDQTKAVLPGVSITATDQETGRQISATSTDKGEYRLLHVPPGKYSIQAELSGFATVVVQNVELLVGQNATIPFSMKLATVSETVTVLGESPLVDTASSQVAGNVDRRQMEELPLQGRNWMELSKLVKGITANDFSDNRPGVGLDDFFQLNLDGQQITQKVAGSGFGQPKFSRESIAEFQIITNLFDITQGRSSGIEVQAISRAGTNTRQGSFYGYFRDDTFNAPDKVAKRVLPYQNQQVGGTLGGPVVRDKIHYFASYEYEREPGTIFSSPPALAGQSFTLPYKITQNSVLGRVDDQLSSENRLSFRGSRWSWKNPFVLGANGHPSNSSVQTKDATNILGTWSRVVSDSKIQEIRLGYNNFEWTNEGQPEVGQGIEYGFSGLTIGKPYNFPQLFYQHNLESRYDLSWHKDKHDMKIGGEFFYVSNTGTWYIQRAGRMTLGAPPADLTTRIPASAAMDPSKWNLAGLDPLVVRFDQNFHPSDWGINIPRPTWAAWFGDTWRLNSQFTVNYGVRWDVDWGVANPPDVILSSIPIDNGSAAAGRSIPGMGPGDYGFKEGIRDNNNVAPRAGFTWNVGGNNSLVIRGGTGLYYTTPVSNVTFSPQIYSQMITASFNNDGRPGFILDPTRGVNTYEQAKAAGTPQSPRIISPDYQNPFTWQSSIGFQKQINQVTGFEADLTHYNEYRDVRTLDPNVFYDPATGYARNPANVGGVPNRPAKQYTQIAYFVSEGHRDQTKLSMALNRRFRNKFQGGMTYSLMFQMKDDGNIGYTAPIMNNVFDYLDGEYATSTEFQRHTVRVWTLYQLPWGFNTSVSYSYGSGNRFVTTVAGTPYGKVGTNRLNLTATGGTANTIVVPAAVANRFKGPASITSGMVIPRNALEGLPLHKVDLRLTKDIRVPGTSVKISLIGEVYNLFDHANYGSYNTVLSATNAAQTAVFGQPAQNTGNAYVPRQAQFAFRVGF